MMFRPISQPRSKPPASDNYVPTVAYYGGEGKLAPGGSLPIGKPVVGGVNFVLSAKTQANTYATRCYSPTTGGGKKAVE